MGDGDSLAKDVVRVGGRPKVCRQQAGFGLCDHDTPIAVAGKVAAEPSHAIRQHHTRASNICRDGKGNAVAGGDI